MSDRKICPVMISGMIGGAFCVPTSKEFECLGSRCTWWVREWADVTWEQVTWEGKEQGPTGNGTCARNPSGEPFPDPAREGEK